MWLSNLLTMSVTWWCVARTKLYIYIFIQIYADSHLLLPKILFNIIWLSNLLTKSGSDEGYSRNERTWWRLFQKRADLMKVIPVMSVPDEGYSRNASCALNSIFTFLISILLSGYTRSYSYILLPHPRYPSSYIYLFYMQDSI
jgi:hypothetical protein